MPRVGGALAELRKSSMSRVAIRDRERRTVRADQNQVGAELLHDVELAFHAIERPRALLGHALEIAKRLEQRAAQPESRIDAADVARALPA